MIISWKSFTLKETRRKGRPKTIWEGRARNNGSNALIETRVKAI